MNLNGTPLNEHSSLDLPSLTSCGPLQAQVSPLEIIAGSPLLSLLLPLGATLGKADAGSRSRKPCQLVRFSDVGWTDVTATTAITTQLLRDIGYSPAVTVLSVPVTFASVANNDIDSVFLGNWMPAAAKRIAPTMSKTDRSWWCGRI